MLEQNGAVERYAALLDPQAIGKRLQAIVEVRLDTRPPPPWRASKRGS
jgi:DNA-binding Lrp family transcriptional regulator